MILTVAKCGVCQAFAVRKEKPLNDITFDFSSTFSSEITPPIQIPISLHMKSRHGTVGVRVPQTIPTPDLRAGFNRWTQHYLEV